MAAASPLSSPIPPLRFTSAPELGRWGDVLLALLIGATVLAGVFAVRDTLAALAPPPPVVSQTVDARIWQPRVVPVEWRWTPAGVDVDRMFRRAR